MKLIFKCLQLILLYGTSEEYGIGNHDGTSVLNTTIIPTIIFA
jgi:hypothetical protein